MMNFLKTKLLALMLMFLCTPLKIGAFENATGHPTTSQTTELSIPLTEADDATLLQYALQLRKTKPELFMGAQGVLVEGVMPNSPSEKKGLQRGDIIVAYHGQQINYTAQLISLIKSNFEKQQVELQFIHAGVIQTIMLQGGQVGIRLRDIVEKVLFEQLPHFLEEGKQAYYTADYPTALKKWEQGLILAGQAKHQQAIGVFLGNIGVVYNHLGQYQKALDYYQQALSFHREIGDKREVGNNLTNIGVVYQNLGQYQKALDYYQQALSFHQGISDRRGEGANLSNIGVVYQNLGQYQKALGYYQQALKIRRKIGDKRGEGANLSNIGMVYQNLGQYQKALDLLQQALKIKREIGDRRWESADLSGIGVVYRNLGQYQKALDYHQQALKIRREIGDRQGEGTDLANLGNVYANLGQYQKALDYYQQTLSLHQEIGDKQGEGATLNNIGAVYQNLGQYQKALDYYQLALKIRQEIDDRQGEGTNLSNIGLMYNNLGQYQKALDYYQQALSLLQKIGDRRGEGATLSNIGVMYENLGQYQKALNYYQQALKIKREIGNRRGEGADLTNLGNVYQNSGQYQQALNYYQQALKIRREIGDRYGEGSDLNNIGVTYEKLGDYKKSKKNFQDSLVIKEKIGADNTWISQRGLAFAEAKFEQYDVAIQHYEQALNNLEKLRVGITAKEYRTSFMRRNLYAYDELIDLLQSLHPKYPNKHYARKAIETFERKQGRLFLEEMGQSGARRFTGLPNDIIQQEQTLVHQWQQKFRFPQEWETLEKEQAKFEAMLAKKYPKYHALKYPQPVDLAILQNQVLQKGEIMLMYGILTGEEVESKTILWVIGKQQFQMLVLKISETELNTKVDAFRQSPNTLTDAIKELPEWDIPDIAEENLPTLRQASYELYQLLVPEKVRILLKKARTLYIVPTDSLYGLPFGALETHDPKQHDTPHYLIQDYPIAYLSSASLLKIIRDTERKESNRYPLLAFADPEYPEKCPLKPDNVAKVIQVARTEAYLKLAGIGEEQCFTDKDELPETKKQAEDIAQLLKISENGDSLQLRDKASRSHVFDFHNKERLDNYQYVLFAAHAVLPDEITRVKQSAIVLSNPDTEGYLTMADVFGLEMNADLVVLSACNTGRGEEIKGEGVRGLTRAFMYAGTPAVSVSLWNVESGSAKDLSIGLFKYLQQGKPLAQALQQSKLDLMKDEDMEMYRHPYFWAPFVVFGDGR